MILAETAETSLGQWGTFLAIVCSSIGGLVLLWRNSVKENRREEQKMKREEERERDKMQVQIEQRDALRQLEVGQTAQNGKLSAIVSVNDAHHTELIRALASNCRFAPTVIQQINETKKEEK